MMKILMMIALMTPVMSVQAGTVSREYLHLQQRKERAAEEARYRESELNARDQRPARSISSEPFSAPTSGAIH